MAGERDGGVCCLLDVLEGCSCYVNILCKGVELWLYKCVALLL